MLCISQLTGRFVPPKLPQTLPARPVTPPSPSQSSSLLSGAHGHFYLHLRAGLSGLLSPLSDEEKKHGSPIKPWLLLTMTESLLKEESFDILGNTLIGF